MSNQEQQHKKPELQGHRREGEEQQHSWTAGKEEHEAVGGATKEEGTFEKVSHVVADAVHHAVDSIKEVIHSIEHSAAEQFHVGEAPRKSTEHHDSSASSSSSSDAASHEDQQLKWQHHQSQKDLSQSFAAPKKDQALQAHPPNQQESKESEGSLKSQHIDQRADLAEYATPESDAARGVNADQEEHREERGDVPAAAPSKGLWQQQPQDKQEGHREVKDKPVEGAKKKHRRRKSVASHKSASDFDDSKFDNAQFSTYDQAFHNSILQRGDQLPFVLSDKNFLQRRALDDCWELHLQSVKLCDLINSLQSSVSSQQEEGGKSSKKGWQRKSVRGVHEEQLCKAKKRLTDLKYRAIKLISNAGIHDIAVDLDLDCITPIFQQQQRSEQSHGGDKPGDDASQGEKQEVIDTQYASNP